MLCCVLSNIECNKHCFILVIIVISYEKLIHSVKHCCMLLTTIIFPGFFLESLITDDIIGFSSDGKMNCLMDINQ